MKLKFIELKEQFIFSLSLSLYIYIYTHTHTHTYIQMGFTGGSDGKESTCNAGDPGLNAGSGRSSGEENGYPLQYSHLENSMDRGAWQAIIHGVTRSWTRLGD